MLHVAGLVPTQRSQEQFFLETQQQLQDGLVRGPFSAAQLDKKYNGCWIPSKRFGVRQNNKIRAVDDFSEFLVNASVTSTEKLQLFGLDEVVNTARTFLGCDFLRCDESLRIFGAMAL